MHSTFAIQTMQCTIDPRIQSTISQDVENYITEAEKSNIDTLIASLHQEYPWIKSIQYTYTTPTTVHLSILAHDPYIQCDETMYISSHGLLIPRAIYEESLYPDLYTVKIPSNTTTMPAELHTFITSIPDALFDRFSIHWQNEHAILLSDKQKPSYTLLADAHTTSFDTITSIANSIDTLLQTHSKHGSTIIDCRFAEQIIIYDAIRGNHGEGSS